ncbi:MAG: hypothetical protein A3F54_00675 [Candidatus Kerfeldbacteria bacterium RIFCSPHIGHO2_12_FULL_48_17]|uniref:Prepilin leader peptidase/N-methyltransferase n=1 Tax=Candidatus Kerfeldbacteria bacterium RIFCSPHIGHO2_12_FULL_48_17 TaxID=1798542 RepID=A0A1G2B5G8_9BACT|nr:MAG: hypothetical protein A3F54_00675 [Candidatus Kerfeldbacteria bacterium RIFCSPHIGHO2_12_FULL_48_17]
MVFNNFFNIAFFVFGACVGSFLNVVALRLPQKKSFTSGRSHCPHCHKTLNWYELIPVLSFIIQGGKCRTCKKQFSWQYPAVEIATGIIFFLCWRNLSDSAVVLTLSLVLAALLIIIFLIDLRKFLILDAVTLPAGAVALLFSIAMGRSWLEILTGGLVGAGFFLIQFVLSRGKWIGGGDIRLGAVMGLALGWQGLLIALFIAYICGSIIGIFLLATKKMTRKDQLPFGTFLSAATAVMMIYGASITQWFTQQLFL